MATSFKYSNHKTSNNRYNINWPLILSVFLINIVSSFNGYSQDKNDFDPVSVILTVPSIGNWEIETLIKKEDIYLPINEIFDYLKIKNTTSENQQTITGFFINPKAIFLIKKINNSIVYKDKTFTLTNDDMIATETTLYLKAKFFGEIFGLEMLFNFRNLSVTLNTAIQLPAIQEMKQQLMRKNVDKLNGEKKADTIIENKFSFIKLGMADWMVTSTQQSDFKNNLSTDLNMGAILAGGEANVDLTYDNFQPFKASKQYYKWRYVNNDNEPLRQIAVGRIYTPSIASIYAPLNGIQFTNAPTTEKRLFGTYRISDKIEPGWMVELYINNVLVNYTKADAAGFFTFDLPLLYGSSAIKLRFYGPYGEERTREQNINIPFIFLPVHKFEYTATAGVIDDEKNSWFIRTNFNYGLAERLTMGGGLEYVSSVMDAKPYPFINASWRLGDNMTLFGQHTPGVKSDVRINYRLPSNLQVDFNYTKYEKGQTAIKFNYIEERSLIVSLPFRGNKFSAFTRLSYNRFTLPEYIYTNAEFLLSTVVGSVSTNITSYAQFIKSGHLMMYSNMAITFQLPASLRFTPQVEYQYDTKRLRTLKVEIEKRIGRIGYINMAYEQSYVNKYTAVDIGVRLNFSFAQTSFSIRETNHRTQIVEAAKGSLMYNKEMNHIGLSSQINVGNGGIIVSPFLDINCNGKRDVGEPKAFGLNVRSNAGIIQHHFKDTTILITGLEAFTDCYLEMDNSNFENIAWQVSKKTLRVKIEPNVFKVVEVAVAVVGEVSGTVYLKDDKGTNGLGRIIVNLYNSDNVLVKRMITEGDGFFDFIGLPPGAYFATVDDGQLNKLRMSSCPTLHFTIKYNKDGDVVSGLQFVLEARK